jgi:hypothetical protein
MTDSGRILENYEGGVQYKGINRMMWHYPQMGPVRNKSPPRGLHTVGHLKRLDLSQKAHRAGRWLLITGNHRWLPTT